MTYNISSIAIILILTIFSCKNKEDKKEEITAPQNIISLNQAQQKASKIQLGKIETLIFEKEIELKGKIALNPNSTVSVALPTSGIVKNIYVKIGDRVRSGQVLATLYNREMVEIQQDYLTAKSNNTYLSKDFQRQKELNESKAVSDKAFHQSDRDFQINQINLQALKQKLINLNINPNNLHSKNIKESISATSQNNGVISKMNIHKGQFLQEGEALMEIASTSGATAVFSVYEKDIPYVAVGQSIEVYTLNNPFKSKCMVKSISPVMKEDNSLDVFCDLVNPSFSIIGNAVIYGKLTSRKAEGKALPKEAIVQFEGKNYIFKKLQNQSFEMVEVIVGSTKDNQVEIEFVNSKEDTNNQWVISGAYALLMSLKNVE
jgi:cobalt-zinc-cadmium efflux system membrane fusion protein